MRKITLAVLVAAAAMVFTACGNKTPKANLKSDVDTLSYAFGMANTQGLKEYLAQMDIDTTDMKAFIKGFNEGVSAGDNKKQAAYYTGIAIGQQVSQRMIKGINQEIYGNDSTQSVSVKNFVAGFVAGVTGKKQIMTPEQAQMLFQQNLEKVKARVSESKYGENKKQGEDFLAANAKKPGIVTLPSGVQYKVLVEGKGEMPKDTSLVTVNYEGRTLDGKVFDSSYKRGQAVPMRANQVIKGFTEVLTHMPVGSTWEVYIPQELAYGAREQGDIKPFSMLIFKLELVQLGAKK